jgi:hypothetical protein
MLLTYIDESGTNYKKEGAFWKDGPFLVWTGLFIDEKKYYHLERLFCDLLKKIDVKNWEKVEAHGTDIWNRKGQFSNLSEQTVKNYFEELFQLLGKLDIQIVLTLEKKSANQKSPIQQKEEKGRCINAFIHAIDHELSKINQTSVLIADGGGDEQMMDDIIFERTKWRYNPGARKTRKRPTKFQYESLSCFILDRIHYMDSSRSLFLQIVDQVSFVMQRVCTYAYLKNEPNPPIVPDLSKVPVTTDTFNFATDNIVISTYDQSKNDIYFYNYRGYFGGNGSYAIESILDTIK